MDSASEKTPSRRQRGIGQNFANQLAQLAAGWQIIVDSAALSGGPAAGTIDFDAVKGSATLNGKPATLSMAATLHEWLFAELHRQELSSSWLLSASVSIQYSGINKETQIELADLTALARIRTSYGDFSASFRNKQPIFNWR